MKVGTDALLLGSLVELQEKTRKALDVGAGTGVISLILAQRFQYLQIDAVEIDERSVAECKENFERSDWSKRLHVLHSDVLDLNSDGVYDLIVSNPPYYATTNINKDERKARARHLESLPVELFAGKCKELLSETGEVWLVFPFDDQASWKKSFGNHGLYSSKEIAIRGKEGEGYIRLITCFTPEKSNNVIKRELTVRNAEGKFSSQYKLLTAELHDRELS